MTPEERFVRIERTLDTIARSHARSDRRVNTHDTYLVRLEAGMERLEGNMERLEGNMDRLEVAMESAFHEQNLKIQKLTAFQATLMESQNHTWEAIDELTRNVDRLTRFQGGNGAHQ